MSRRSTDPPANVAVPTRHPDAPGPGEEIPSHYRLCFGCGEDHPTGLHLRVRAGEGVALTAELAVGEHHQGAPGLAHGGLLAAAFDEALGALIWLLRTPAVTARLETDFRRPVPVGSRLYLDAEVIGVARRKIYTRAVGRLGAVDGPVAVSAAAVFVTVPLEHFVTHGRPEDVEAARTEARVLHSARMYEVNP